MERGNIWYINVIHVLVMGHEIEDACIIILTQNHWSYTNPPNPCQMCQMCTYATKGECLNQRSKRSAYPSTKLMRIHMN